MKLKREPAEQTPEQVFAIAADKIAHDLKIIEISRRVMGRSKRVLPFALIGVVLTGFPLLASTLSVSPFGILLFGGLFSGAMSQLVGPYGSWSRLQSEPKKIEGRIDSLQEGLANFPTVASFVVFGVKSISKSKIVFSEKSLRLDEDVLLNMSRNGLVPTLAPYKFLGVAMVEPDGTLICSLKSLDQQDWLNFAKFKGFTVQGAEEALQTLRA